MGFMQRDIDFKLILLILVVIIAIVGLTLFYQSSAGNIIRKYNKVTEKLEASQENLTVTSVKLKACDAKIENLTVELNEALDYQVSSQDEFNSLYTETKSSLEETQSSLSRAEEDLEDTEAELSQSQSDLDSCETTKQSYEDAADKANNYAANAQSTLDECQGCTDVNSCHTCINEAMGDVSTIQNYLDEIEG